MQQQIHPKRNEETVMTTGVKELGNTSAFPAYMEAPHHSVVVSHLTFKIIT